MVSFRHLFDNGRVIHTASCYGNNDLEVVEKTEEGESIRLLLVKLIGTTSYSGMQ